MNKLLLGFVIVVTLCWSPTFRANPVDSEPVLRLVPLPEPRMSTIGLASWYGEKFQGRNTANGEAYDMNGLTAAHRELPMGTRVVITNVRNGRSVTVRINDRGPSIPGRMIDVSKAAARALGFVGAGTTIVTMKVAVRPASSKTLPSGYGLPVLISSAAPETAPPKKPTLRQN
jgi:rare lipoprotein A (peptidoglycan hydrolase)